MIKLPTINKYGFLPGLMVGAVIGLTLIWTYLWPLALAAGVLLLKLFALNNSKYDLAMLGFGYFVGKLAVALSFIWQVYPISWLGLGLGKWELIPIGIFWACAVLATSLAGLVLGLMVCFLKQKLPGHWLLGVLLFWVPVEVLGSWFFSVVMLGQGSELNITSSVAYSGYSLIESGWLLYIAKWGGAYALSYLFILLAIVFYSLWFSGRIPLKRLAAVLFITIVLLPSPLSDNKEYGLPKIAIINTFFDGGDLTQGSTVSRINIVNEAVDAALALDYDQIILPEASNYTNTELSPDRAFNLYRFETGDTKSVLIDTTIFETQNKRVVRSVIYDPLSQRVWAVDKQYLVPQGEYLPTFYTRALSLLGFEDEINKLNSKMSFFPGPIEVIENKPRHIPEILFCFDSVDAMAAKRLVSRGEVGYIAHPFSHTWFNQSTIIKKQLDTMLRVQSIWAGVPIVSAGNQARGRAYWPNGSVSEPKIVKSGSGWEVAMVN
jgi:apolipoprotein N-acyltransferase